MSRNQQPGPFVGGLTRLVWQWVRRRIHDEVVAAGFDDLNPAHVAVFRSRTLDGMRPGELADDMQITKQSVNEILGHLERRGYVVREPDPIDNRGRRIRLTERGREVEAAAWAAAEQAEQRAAELIGEERMRELRRSLSDLVALLGLSSDARPEEPRRQGVDN